MQETVWGKGWKGILFMEPRIIKRIAVAIPHYYKYNAASKYQSGRATAQERAEALKRCIQGIHTSLDSSTYATDQVGIFSEIHKKEKYEIDITVCVNENNHVLELLGLPEEAYHIKNIQGINPLYLGYECHDVLQNKYQEGYDYLIFIEDDVVLDDEQAIQKIDCFCKEFGPSYLLQPNRYEYADGLRTKYFIEWSKKVFKRITNREGLSFVQIDNPHAGCFFMNRSQMERMINGGLLGKRCADFVSPLDSAATYAIMNTFSVMKPALENAFYFQLEHYTKCMTEPPFALYSQLTMEAEEWKAKIGRNGICIWGASGRFQRFYNINKDIEIAYIIDKNKEAKDLLELECPIKKPSDIKLIDLPVFITSTYIREIREQLEQIETKGIYFWQKRGNRLTDISDFKQFELIEKKLFIE